MPEVAAAPIFIQGIYPRSGTNHLLNLLCVHPDCASPSPIWENQLLARAQHLDAYVDAVSASWNPDWGVVPAHERALLAALGEGIGGFLRGLADGRRVVTKTPRVDQLSRFGALFPRAFLLILVRDGRAVVESGARSFRWFRDGAIHGWAEAARSIRDFDAAERGGNLRYRIVRYEQLVEAPETCLKEILEFLELDVARYDFAQAKALPVRGSSSVGRRSGEAVHWDGSPRAIDFDPVGRWRQWSRWQHARFNWIAGDALRDLGYAPVKTQGGSAERVWNLLLDLRYCGARALRPAVNAWRRRNSDR